MSKLSIVCTHWRAYHKNTLRGFADITIDEMQMEIREIAVHVMGERRWVGLPAKPMIKNGMVVSGDDGKPKYTPVLAFANRAVADRFGEAVIAALIKIAPGALEEVAA